ncbi:MAG: hypothetical protein HUK22_08110, partial [Thermoguttaceae bacterium]|nr:hypothetical protein [Thermoguttaceae bacterium]
PAAEEPTPAPAAPAVEEPASAPAAPAVEESAPAPAAPAAEEPAPAPVAAAISSLFFSFSRAGLSAALTGALVLDEAAQEAPAEPTPAPRPVDIVAQEQQTAPAASAAEEPASEIPAGAISTPAPGVYVVVNPDGALTLASSDQAALDEFQRRLTEAALGTDAADDEEPAQTDAPNMDPSDPASRNYFSFMTPENIAKARELVLMESRNYTVYRVENVGVNQLLPRLQTYMAERVQDQRNAFGSYYPLASSGISIQSIAPATQLNFQADPSLNTITVYGSLSDRNAAGAMIVVLDKVELFPQPITKPYKIRVENTSPVRMAQEVLNAFSRKFQTTLLPGNLSPRIVPNMTTNMLEVYAPEELAKEIEEYVLDVDKDILEESVRKVRVVELKSMNSTVLASYMQNLRARQQVPQTFSTPYVGSTMPIMGGMMNMGGYRGGMGGYGGMNMGYPGGMGGMNMGYPGGMGGVNAGGAAGRVPAAGAGAGAAAGARNRGV